MNDSAPSLLEACERAEWWLDTVPGGEAMRDVLRAAIAKARSEPSDATRIVILEALRKEMAALNKYATGTRAGLRHAIQIIERLPR